MVLANFSLILALTIVSVSCQFSGFGQSLTGVLDGVTKTATGAVDAVSKTTGAVISGTTSTAGKTITTTVDTAGKTLGGIGTGTADTVGKTLDGVVAGTTGAGFLDGIGKTLSGTVNIFGSSAGQIFNETVDQLTGTMGGVIKQIGHAQTGLMEVVKGALSNNTVTELIKGISTPGSAILKSLASMTPTLQLVGAGVMSAFKQVLDLVLGILLQIFKAVMSNINAANPSGTKTSANVSVSGSL